MIRVFSVEVFVIYSFVWGLVHSAVSCPYSEINLNKEGLLPDRLIGEKPPTLAGPQKGKRVEAPAPTPTVPEPSDDSPQSRKSWSTESERSGRNSAQCLPEQTPSTEERTEGTGEPSENGIKARKTGPIPKCLKLHLVKQELGDGKETALSLQEALHESVFIPPFSSNPAHRIQVCWEQHCRLLPEVLGLTAKGVAKWTIEEIDGEAFLLLTQADIVKILGIKLGPALKIYNSILMCKSADEDPFILLRETQKPCKTVQFSPSLKQGEEKHTGNAVPVVGAIAWACFLLFSHSPSVASRDCFYSQGAPVSHAPPDSEQSACFHSTGQKQQSLQPSPVCTNPSLRNHPRPSSHGSIVLPGQVNPRSCLPCGQEEAQGIFRLPRLNLCEVNINTGLAELSLCLGDSKKSLYISQALE
ncbi:LMBL1 protein, partial [Polyodon spathula]|nr:LMBL1 protein [Polyodon spathula]